MEGYDLIGIGTKDMPRLAEILWSQLGLEQWTDHNWETLVSTRIGTEDRAYWETFGLNQDWNRGQSILGNFLSQPGLERRTYHDRETFCLNQDWNGG